MKKKSLLKWYMASWPYPNASHISIPFDIPCRMKLIKPSSKTIQFPEPTLIIWDQPGLLSQFYLCLVNQIYVLAIHLVALSNTKGSKPPSLHVPICNGDNNLSLTSLKKSLRLSLITVPSSGSTSPHSPKASILRFLSNLIDSFALRTIL